MNKRILISTTTPETLAVILRNQPKHLNQHFNVSLCTSNGPELKEIKDEFVPVYLVPMVRGISPFKDLISIFQMIILLRKIRPQLVHSYTPKAGLVCMVAAWICRVPVRVHTFTGLIWPTAKGFRRKLLMIVDQLLCACATSIIPEGLGVQKDLETAKITPKQLRVIGHGNIAGVDITHFSVAAEGVERAASELRQRYNIQDYNFVYIYVGRLNRDKGIEELLSAFIQLNDNCRLLLVGGLDKTAPISDKAIRTIQDHPRIHWIGFQKDIRPALLAADVLVLPSYREGFPNAVLQAGAMELPVVATDISGCNEIIEPGFNGWLVPTRNSYALQQAMQEALLTPKSDFSRMGKMARERVTTRFERTAHWQRMVQFYQEILSKSII